MHHTIEEYYCDVCGKRIKKKEELLPKEPKPACAVFKFKGLLGDTFVRKFWFCKKTHLYLHGEAWAKVLAEIRPSRN